MSKFSGTRRRPLRANLTAPVRTVRQRTLTHEGGQAFLRASSRNSSSSRPRTWSARTRSTSAPPTATTVRSARAPGHRYQSGVRAGLAPYLRQTMLMRSAAVVMAAEYVAAGGPHGRAVVDAVLQRADEPAEMLGYWITAHGRNVPMAVKRGVADAARRLYTERVALRYDGLSRQVRMADVIELTHPRPCDDRQSALFRWLLDRRHHDDAAADRPRLPVLAASAALDAVAPEDRRAVLRHPAHCGRRRRRLLGAALGLAPR